MDSLFGFVIGMTLSLSCMLSLITVQRRRQLEALEGLIARGRYRIVKDDGSAAAATELLEAISNSPSRRYGDPNQRLIAVLLAVILFTTAGGVIVFFASR
jgi:hypothetical protein